MSAASPKTQDKSQEPSMEEILASIRRIIADDQKPAEPPAAGSRPVAVPNPAPDEDDVLDLAMVAKPAPKPPAPKPAPQPPAPPPAPKPEPVAKAPPPKPEPRFDEIDAMSEIAFRDEPMDFDALEIEPEPEPAPPPPPKAVAAPPPPALEDRLLSQATDATVGHAFDLLASTVLTRNARTLEDLVQDMLRPMLKAWLDDNLPVMVERLVRAEIERVARGR
ncbi:PopZ family protein [Methylobacterium aquaticum]|uniref:PopZ family protein n=1 Tax=Methylobacterium aquaticum TaxID=270351 RepID=UPI003D17FACB